ncbi:uncharacterized protein METZ01_LOCUS857 [marine metagenome]|uniref:Uncharacterized protein n=1 Tax=marine metagenome TaxID=408172 RepID=A0A381N300_9ZZZZ
MLTKNKNLDNIWYSLAGVACSSEKKIFLEGLLARLYYYINEYKRLYIK